MKKSIFLLLLCSLLAFSACSDSGGASESSSDNAGSSAPAVTDAEGEGAAAPEAASAADLDVLVSGLCEKYSLTEGFIFSSYDENPDHYPLDDDLIQSYYGDANDMPDFSKVSDYCLYVDESDPKIIIDVGVFRLNDPAYADTLMQYLRARINVKIENGARYPDIDVATLKKSVVEKSGDTVFYVISYESAAIAGEIREAVGK